jgi:vacuolar protein sorting-associated protein 13A/C
MNFCLYLVQSKTTLAIQELGMSFGRMDAPSDQVRFLDDVNITLALDSSDQGSRKHTNIVLDTQPIVFRASLTDIMLITDVVNYAIALAAASSCEKPTDARRKSLAAGSPKPDMVAAASAKSTARSRRSSRLSFSRPAPANPQVLISRESVSSDWVWDSANESALMSHSDRS